MTRWLSRLMDAQDRWVKPLGAAAHGFLNWLFRPIPVVRDLLNGRWLGHPVHAVLTDGPIGILFLVIVFDVLGQTTAAEVALAVGLLAVVAAALAGFADYSDTDGKPRDRATLHATLMITATMVYLISLGLRLVAIHHTVAIWLSAAGFLVLSAGAYVGGDIVYVFGNQVSRHAFRGAGAKWIGLEPAERDADGSIPEGRPIKAKLGANQLVLVRDGERILALHDTCAHAACSLSGGSMVGETIECPCHGSRYRLRDGLVVRGPSVYDQPTYEVRATEGGGWEARRRS